MSQPPSRLNAGLFVRKEDVPDTVQPPVAASRGRVVITYRPTPEVHDFLREAAFKQKRPMQALLDQAVEMLRASLTE